MGIFGTQKIIDEIAIFITSNCHCSGPKAAVCRYLIHHVTEMTKQIIFNPLQIILPATSGSYIH